MENAVFVLVSIVCCVCGLFVFRFLLKDPGIRDLFLSYDKLLHPNSLSLYGLVSTVIGFALLLADFPHCALVFYTMASFLDGADGSTARAIGKVSDTGKLLDPLCDKFRYFLLLAYFYHLEVLVSVPLLVFFLADLTSQFSRTIISRSKFISGTGIKANVFGKAKTVVADILVGYCFLLYLEPLFPNFTSIVIFVLCGLAVLSTVFKFFSFGETVDLVWRKLIRRASVA